MAHLTAKPVLEMVVERAHGPGTGSHALRVSILNPGCLKPQEVGVTTLCEKKSSSTYCGRRDPSLPCKYEV
jgi:hypothetical protein